VSGLSIADCAGYFVREIETITGAIVRAQCLSCAMISGPLSDYAGTVFRGRHFHAHQDVEIALPGFVVVSTVRHIASTMQFSSAEREEFSSVLVRLRYAQNHCGLKNVYLFQNEDTLDHFHLWMFPIYDWMLKFGKGPALLSAAINALRTGEQRYVASEALAVARLLRAHVGAQGE